MQSGPAAISFKAFLTVSEAAHILGVSAATMRNWDRAGKLKPVRHPLNGYRLYRRIDLENIVHQMSSSDSTSSKH